MGWLIALGVIGLLASVPLGATVRYDEHGPLAKLILGPVRLTLYPRPKKEKKKETVQEENMQPVEKPEEPAPQAAPQEKAAEKTASGGSLTDFLPLVKTGLDLLRDLKRKLRVNRLDMKLTLAADDPCDLAVNYGRAWAAVGNLMPRLERSLVIRKRNVEVQCDFTASETRITARMDITITLGRLLALAVVYGIRTLREFLAIRKKRKGGAAT